MLCKYNGLGPWAVQTGRQDSSVVVFIPGPNTIPDHDYELIKGHPEVAKRIKEGKLEIVVESVAKAAEQSGDSEVKTELGGLSAKDAVKIVKETFNTVELNKWKEDETRPSVLKAIEDQLGVIEKERAEAASKSGDGSDE